MKAQAISFYFDLISNRKKGFFAAILRALLRLFSLIFAAGSALRKKCIVRSYRPKAFTISIGNLVAGGTGKTPFTVYLAEMLMPKYRVGILLRGYKAEAEKKEMPTIVQSLDPHLIGDEACLIARHVPDAQLFVGRKKSEAAKMADERGVQMLLVDDGMQHLALQRDLEIVMLDSQNPFGYEYLLPRGLLREPVSALSRADFVVITCRNGESLSCQAKEVIQSHTKAPIIQAHFENYGLYDLQDRPHTLAANTKVGLFCAIAKPEQFVTTISAYGLDIVHKAFMLDHDTVTGDELAALQDAAKRQGATCLVCTEKDLVKLAMSERYDLPIYWLKVGATIAPSPERDVLFAALGII